MRIAISGTHLSGKSALLRALQKELPKFEVFDEPYWMLSELGREFSDPPTIEEFEEQLDYSIELIEQSPVNALFDRCPIDFLGYSRVIAEETSDEFDQEVWEAKIGEALTYLDLIVFLPIETPDLIALPESEDKYFRIQVDEKLRSLIVDDSSELMHVEVLEVTGTIKERVEKIKQKLCLMKN